MSELRGRSLYPLPTPMGPEMSPFQCQVSDCPTTLVVGTKKPPETLSPKTQWAQLNLRRTVLDVLRPLWLRYSVKKIFLDSLRKSTGRGTGGTWE